jgi:5'-deoxynucleotidase YfbR-like HD superfamily hydrolase
MVDQSTFPPYPGLKYLDLAYSAQYLDRFHMCRMLHSQNLAAHSHRVAVTARVLLAEWRDRGGPKEPSDLSMDKVELHMYRYALDHDLIETLTGDAPSHSKTPVIKAEMKEMERKVMEMVVDADRYLYHSVSDDAMENDEDLKAAKVLVKLADIAEGLVFSFYNQGLGHTVPDAKYNWVNNNWARIARKYVEQLSDDFGPDFRAWYLAFVVDGKMAICPQHA